MEPRFARHRRLAAAFKAGVEALGLRQLPVSSDKSANTLSALYYPEGVDATLVKGVLDAGVIIAGGLLPGVKEKYFRVGHMGAVTSADIISTLGAIELALKRTTYRFNAGDAVRAAQERLM
jgi:alanine-glyoxylate transaminase/serine-glyoxylate transaminase/serine-pyruvate transaminase